MGVVLAPANGRGAAAALVEAGACELYLGFHDPAWEQAFPGVSGLNRMSGFGPEANVLSFDELLDEARRVRGLQAADGRPVRLFCTLNSASYTTRQARFIRERYLPGLADAGFEGVIVSGPQLMPAAREAGLAAVASTMCAVYNQDTARFYQEQGAARIIVPRDLSTEEIAQLVRAVPGMQVEAFLMRNGCVFADAHCLGLHRSGRPSVCRAIRQAPYERQLSNAAEAADPMRWEQHAGTVRTWQSCFHENTCGLCALWRLEQLGIAAYKVVGRGDSLGDLCADVSLTWENVQIARSCATEADYLERMVRPQGILECCNTQGLSCYYPGVRFA